VIVGRREKNPLEEIKNIIDPVTGSENESAASKDSKRAQSPFQKMERCRSPPTLATPLSRPRNWNPPSAMKGVIMTATGEALSTPAPGALTTVFMNSPQVGLNFGKIFESPKDEDRDTDVEEDDDGPSPPPSPSKRAEERQEQKKQQIIEEASEQPSVPPTRIRRPSIRTSRRPNVLSLPSSISDGVGGIVASAPAVQPKPLPHPHLQPAAVQRIHTAPVQRVPDAPQYDFLDEENLPSPFLKRVERVGGSRTLSKRPSNGNTLRTIAAVNSAGRRGKSISHPGEYAIVSPTEPVPSLARPTASNTRTLGRP
jgi:NIMA (never in mitosis gene a)-related kinase 2